LHTHILIADTAAFSAVLSNQFLLHHEVAVYYAVRDIVAGVRFAVVFHGKFGVVLTTSIDAVTAGFWTVVPHPPSVFIPFFAKLFEVVLRFIFQVVGARVVFISVKLKGGIDAD